MGFESVSKPNNEDSFTDGMVIIRDKITKSYIL